MTQTSVQPGVARPRLSLASRFFGMITAPRATYESVAGNPAWFGMLALTTVAMALLVGGFLFTQVGQEAWLEAAATSPFSGPVSDQQYEGMRKMSGYVGYITVALMLLMVPVVAAILSGILFAIFNAALGGEASYRELLSVVVHTGPIALLAQLFTLPMNYVQGTMSSSTNLGVLTRSMLDDESFIARLLGRIDIFVIWQLIVLSMGLAVLYRRRTQPVAVTLLAIYFTIGVIVAIVTVVRRGAGA